MHINVSPGLAAFCTAYKAKTPEGAIRGAWQNIIRSLNLSAPPISLKPVCNALGVSVYWQTNPLSTKRGNASLSLENGGLVIRVHSAGTSAWRYNRFLVAHELTHALLIKTLNDSDLIYSLDASKEDFLVLERICDLGAHELLMPSSEFRKAMSSVQLGPDLVRLLYDRFLVTTTMVAERIAFLTPRGAVLRLRKHARTSEESIEWRVMSSYPRYKYQSDWPWLPKGATLKHLPGVSDLDTLSLSQDILKGQTQIKLSGRCWLGDYIAFALPPPRASSINQPMLENFLVPDELMPKYEDIFLFISEARAEKC